MASSSITKPQQIIPSLELPNLEIALTDLQNGLARLPELAARAASINCDSPAAYAELVKVVDEMQDIGKAGEAKMRPFLNISNDVSNFLHTERKNQEQAAKQVFQPHLDRAAKWKREEREAAEREQQRIRAEDARIAREKAEAQRKEDEAAAKEKRQERVKEIRGMLKRGEIGKRKAEQLLREAGATEEADKARAAADAEQVAQDVPKSVVQPNVPKIAGRRGTVQYFAEFTDFDALLLAYTKTFSVSYALSELPTVHERRAYLRRFISPNESELSKEAKEVKNSKKMMETIPGIYASDKDTV